MCKGDKFMLLYPLGLIQRARIDQGDGTDTKTVAGIPNCHGVKVIDPVCTAHCTDCECQRKYNTMSLYLCVDLPERDVAVLCEL